MKPRIKLSAYRHAPDPTGTNFRWQCVTPGIMGHGPTPNAAYRTWELRMKGVIE